MIAVGPRVLTPAPIWRTAERARAGHEYVAAPRPCSDQGSSLLTLARAS